MHDQNHPYRTVSDRDDEGLLASVVESLCGIENGLAGPLKKDKHGEPMPSRAEVVEMVELIRAVLFPGYFGHSEMTVESMRFHIGSTLDRISQVMQEQAKRGICFFCEEEEEHCGLCDRRARQITRMLLGRLPDIQKLLATDIRAAYEGDPAATSPDEAIFCYPGVLAISSYRIAHELYGLGVPIIPRMVTEHAHSITGIDIHPGATIGKSFFIDHGTGVVIGETTIIGDRVRIYQGVTLGAKSFAFDDEGNPSKGVARHPIVEDDVIIYSGATILGRVTIGHDSVIGGNVWLVNGVPPHSRVTQAMAHKEEFQGGSGI